ncbi:MAG: hypothetical protein M0C28_46145 [Candidatus Moduliflexus flocculans]|nr:hypothetical protein [Candidatus Moduliflexus flocculans]
MLAAALILAAASGCGRGSRPSPAGPIVGVKIYEHPGPFGPLVDEWRGLGVDTVFAGEALARNADFRGLLRSNGLALYLIFPVFQDPEAVKANPGLAAVTAAGIPARDEWVEFVCPAREDFLARRIDELRRAVAAVDPDVVSLDFIRYFVFWEKVAPDRTPASLPQTCFCPVCLAGFEKEMQRPSPDGYCHDTRESRLDTRPPRGGVDGVEVPDDRPGRRAPGRRRPRRQARHPDQSPRRPLAGSGLRRGGRVRGRPGPGPPRPSRRHDLTHGLPPHGGAGPRLGPVRRRGRCAPDEDAGPGQHPGRERLCRDRAAVGGVPVRPRIRPAASLRRRRPLVLGCPVQVAGEDADPEVAFRIEKIALIR